MPGFHDPRAERSGLFKVVQEGLSDLFVVKKDLELDHPTCIAASMLLATCAGMHTQDEAEPDCRYFLKGYVIWITAGTFVVS